MEIHDLKKRAVHEHAQSTTAKVHVRVFCYSQNDWMYIKYEAHVHKKYISNPVNISQHMSIIGPYMHGNSFQRILDTLRMLDRIENDMLL